MKITYIENFSVPHGEQWKAAALRRLGVEVTTIEESHVESPWHLHDGYTYKKILQDKPDVLLYAKLKIPLHLRGVMIEKAKEDGIKTVCWVPDLYFGLSREYTLKDQIFRSDYVLTPDGGNDERFKSLGINHRLLRQSIPPEDCYLGEKTNSPEIVFFGSFNAEFPYRTETMHFLRRTYGGRFHWYGRENPSQVRGKGLNDMINSAKIVIGDSVYSPHYWSNRIYETLGRGGFLIHPLVPGIESHYTPYQHFVPYNYHDFQGLKEKIDYFLEHPKDRERIRMAGFEHTKKHHTLDNRVKEFLTIINEAPNKVSDVRE